jgi:hypothetical protein
VLIFRIPTEGVEDFRAYEEAVLPLREFITLLGGAAVTWPLTARAQQAMRVIGFMGGSTASSQGQWAAAFAQRLRELGWVEGRNVAIEYRWAEGRSERTARSRPSSSGSRSISSSRMQMHSSPRQSRRHRSSRSCSGLCIEVATAKIQRAADSALARTRNANWPRECRITEL